MRTTTKRVVTGIATLAAIAALTPLTAEALPPGTPPAGVVAPNPSSGTSGTAFSLAFASAPQFCPGDNTQGYLWHTFLTPVANDPATLTYSGSGAPSAGVNLRTAAGSQIRNQAPGLGDGLVQAPTGLSFASVAFDTLAPGDYWIGIACTKPDVDGVAQTERYWARGFTITATTGTGTNPFTWALGLRPAPPVLNTVTPDDGSLTVAFTPPTGSDPAITGFTATATPQGGGTPVTQTGTTSPITLTGLTNGVTYDVTVTATNSVGTSDPSNMLSATPNVQPQPPVQNLTATPGPQSCTISFAAPAGGLPPTGYLVQLTTSTPPDPQLPKQVTITAPPLSHTFTGLVAGTSYTVVVTPQHTAPNFGQSATTTCIPQSAQLVVQEISVVRPPGALVLTQRCGVYGELPADPNTNAFPGFPQNLPAVPANNVDPGTSPTLGPNGTAGPDPQFGEYPYPQPPSYPTYCGLNLGTARLATKGVLAGYYTADGRLNQVTVVDTRDGDLGWTLNGTMSSFSDGLGVTFSGNYLGWVPRVNDVSGVDSRSDVDPGDGRRLTGITPGYTQVVTAGPEVDPGSGVGGGTGLVDGKVLASANPNQGLGVAVLDARIKLLIPPSVPAGTYAARLTLSFL